MMYKVLIVDDEIFVRRGLINLMDWNSLQYEICGEAENGEQAIEMIDKLQPDLVIADIRMPILDGLELIKRVKEEREDPPLFIIVSGYHDFTYAQKALRYNVQDYILKPIDEEELETTLKKLAVTLNQKRISTITLEKPIKETIIQTLLQSEHSDLDIEHLASVLLIPAEAEYSYVLIEVQDIQTDGTIDYAPILKAFVANYFGEHVHTLPVHVRDQNQYGLLLPTFLLQNVSSGNMQEQFVRLRGLLVKDLGTDVAVFVGKPVDHLKDIAHSFRSANESLNYKFTEKSKQVIFAEEVLTTSLYYFDVDEELHSKLINEIEENQSEAYEATVAAIFAQFQDKRFAPSAVANTITRSLIGIINIIRQMEGSEEELKLLDELLSWQRKYRSLSQLQHIYLQFVHEAAVYLAEVRSEQKKGNIEKIKKYIDANFTENINLKSIASKFYLNSVYLGQLFRKTYGVYFNEYLLSLRIEEAKRLLRQKDLRMYEVAEKVGFQNADYFVTQFEKLEKMTPTDYRNKMLGKK